jgi:hypothetical protein
VLKCNEDHDHHKGPCEAIRKAQHIKEIDQYEGREIEEVEDIYILTKRKPTMKTYCGQYYSVKLCDYGRDYSVKKAMIMKYVTKPVKIGTIKKIEVIDERYVCGARKCAKCTAPRGYGCLPF